MATTIMTGVNLTATLGCGSYNNFVNMRTDRTNDYRLSDALQGRYASMDHRQLLQYYARWQGSIVHEYLKLTNKTKLDTSILFDVVQKKKSPSDKSVAVLHVRLGDVVTKGHCCGRLRQDTTVDINMYSPSLIISMSYINTI